MRRKIFAILAANVLVVTWATAQVETEPYNRSLINQNNVKAQTTYDYDYINGKPAQKGTRSLAIKFDGNGNKIEEIGYKSKGAVHYVQTYKYDEKSRLLEYVKYRGNREVMEYKMSVKYDGKGNKQLESGFNGTEAFRNVYKYGDDGKLDEITYFVGNRVDERRVYKQHGSITDITVLNASGAQQYKLRDTYDGRGNILKEEQFDNNNNITRKLDYTYDGRGNQTSEEKYMQNKRVYRIQRAFDGQGKLIEVYQENNSTPRFLANKYKYDGSGRLIEEQYRSDSARDFSKNVYRYENNGLRKTVDSYFASYKYQVLYVYAYETY
jgi:hypothetical protein